MNGRELSKTTGNVAYPEDLAAIYGSDNRFLELSVHAKANYLITGNTNDFTEDKYENVDIVTPREFWDKFSE